MKNLLIAVFALVSSVAFAAPVDSFLPPNKMLIPLRHSAHETLIEKEFHEILDEAEQVYAPIVAAHGAVLEMRRAWEDGTVNAWTTREGKTWIVQMYGGLARHAAVTPDAFRIVVCHELGHQLGGYPFKRDYSGKIRWASAEGQSDYYATSKCMRRLFKNDSNVQIVSRMKKAKEVHPKVDAMCKKSFEDADDYAICVRSAMGGIALANLFANLSKDTASIDVTAPATAKTNFDGYPKSQCRLETFVAGAVCAADYRLNPTSTNANFGYCAYEKGEDGFRPLCWYNPKESHPTQETSVSNIRSIRHY